MIYLYEFSYTPSGDSNADSFTDDFSENKGWEGMNFFERPF